MAISQSAIDAKNLAADAAGAMMHWRRQSPRTKAEILETRLGLYYPWRKRGVIEQTMAQFRRLENIHRFRRWRVAGGR